MGMTREQIKQRMTELLGLATPENQARASEILTDLGDEFESVLTESENSATRVQELTANNETLRAVNAKLFLKVGTSEKDVHVDETPKDEFEGDKQITFEELFNEKGELM